jgi:hypothetical protein
MVGSEILLFVKELVILMKILQKLKKINSISVQCTTCWVLTVHTVF